VSTENTKAVLTEFLERVLGIKDAQSIEYQRVHRMGKPRKENEKERIITARDRERVLKCGWNSRTQDTRCMKTSQREIHEMRKLQMEKLKNARDGKHAY